MGLGGGGAGGTRRLERFVPGSLLEGGRARRIEKVS